MSFRLSQQVANGAIPNNIPGTWEAHVGGITDFSPSQNKPPQGKAKDISGCTTWLTDYHTTSLTVTSTVTINCDEDEWPQACAHYNSVGSYLRQPVITCPWQNQGSKDRLAPTLWDAQHKKAWRNFVDSFGNPLYCQRDEYPPLYFMPIGRLNDWPQAIRLLPRKQNRDAGQTWKGLCKEKLQVVNSEGGSIVDGTCQSTITTVQSVRAMSIAFDTRYLRQYDDWLSVNPCSISTALTSDRGFVLFGDDPWYTLHSTHKPKEYYLGAVPSTLLNNIKRSIQNCNDNRLNHEQIEALAAYGYHFVSIPSSLTDLNSDFITVEVGNTTRRANDDDVSAILQIIDKEFLWDDFEYDKVYYGDGPTMANPDQTATWDSPVTSSVVLASSSSITFAGTTTPAATAPKPVLTIATSSKKLVPTESAEENKRNRGVKNAATYKHIHFNYRYRNRYNRNSL